LLFRLFNIAICVLLSAGLFAQNKFSGRVLDQSNNAAIAGASVYFNNTSIGTITNENGEFSIPNPINGEVIISSVGYERLIHKLSITELTGKSFTFKLAEKEAMLRDVMVLPDAMRKQYLQLFKENFLGLTEEADMSRITNLHSIDFAAGDEKNAFIAYSDTPLTIINKKLGYIIKFDLVEFYLNQRTGQTSFYGFTRYEEMGDKKRWARNREKAYYGSTLHFFRSLIGNNLEKESFSILRVRVDSLRQTNALGKLFYKKMDVGIPITATEIIKKDPKEKLYIASWKDKLMVQYLKNPASKAYLSKRTIINGNLPKGARSYLLLNEPTVGIDDYGILADPMNVFYTGYWSYEKAANLLPYNYYPDRD